RPDTGSSLKVSGSSIATVATGPMPGSTPISVPTRQPTSAKPRLAQGPATPKPRVMLSRKSTSPLRPDGHRQGEAPAATRDAQERQHDGGDRDLDHPHMPAREAADDHQRARRDDEAPTLGQERERNDRQRDEDQRAPGRAVLGHAVVDAEHALQRDGGAEDE